MIARTIPIQQVKPNLSDAVRMAVAEIERFLGLFYPMELIEQTQAAKAIAGQWLSRVKGFHNDDDFLHLTRDFLSFVLSGGERSQVSDQLGYYFSGFMPSYGATCALLDMVADGRDWSEVQAFMHSQSYGDARKYVEGFDWAGGQKKAQAEIDAWKEILEQQVKSMESAAYGEPVLVAQANPQPVPNGPITDMPPANDPHMPRPKPSLRVVPRAPIGGGVRAFARFLGPFLLRTLPQIEIIVTPSNVGQENVEEEWLRRRAEYEKKNKLPIPDASPKAETETDTTNNDCKAQTEQNKKNGAECENDGYVIMEQALQYKRLIDPPKGKGLDGLFEKNLPFNMPDTWPTDIKTPKPGKLIFIPPTDKPPQVRYDFAGNPPKSTYPKFVVFEAKHVAKPFEENDTEGIKKEAKNRLGNTCDGQQMGKDWTEPRIEQALKRKYPGSKNRVILTDKVSEITKARYARWIFICLPGGIGSKAKLYVFIDVDASGLDLESKPPIPRKPKPSAGDHDL